MKTRSCSSSPFLAMNVPNWSKYINNSVPDCTVALQKKKNQGLCCTVRHDDNCWRSFGPLVLLDDMVTSNLLYITLL